MTKCSVARQKKFFFNTWCWNTCCRRWPRTSRGRGIRCGVTGRGWSIQYGRIPGKFLEQVSRRWLSIGFARLTLPLSLCYPLLLEKDNAFVDFATPRRLALQPGSPRFQHLCQSFSATLWDSPCSAFSVHPVSVCPRRLRSAFKRNNF